METGAWRPPPLRRGVCRSSRLRLGLLTSMGSRSRTPTEQSACHGRTAGSSRARCARLLPFCRIRGVPRGIPSHSWRVKRPSVSVAGASPGRRGARRERPQAASWLARRPPGRPGGRAATAPRPAPARASAAGAARLRRRSPGRRDSAAGAAPRHPSGAAQTFRGTSHHSPSIRSQRSRRSRTVSHHRSGWPLSPRITTVTTATPGASRATSTTSV